ncbi:MAG: hypothetical protein L0G99_17355, partial [Propionibacteriales bacterium]|nr:hypothetical protein [Propionibacteriales bacterium]
MHSLPVARPPPSSASLRGGLDAALPRPRGAIRLPVVPQLRIALVQMNPTVGAIDANADAALE